MRDRASAHILVACLGLALAACHSPTPPADGPTADDRAATRAALRQARGRWSSLGISDYSYAFRRSCFCAPPFTSPVRITVRDGRVAEVVLAETGQAASPEGYPTVDDLFGILQEAVDSSAYDIRATYDPARGYPTSFYIDRSPAIADEELGVEASDLRS